MNRIVVVGRLTHERILTSTLIATKLFSRKEDEPIRSFREEEFVANTMHPINGCRSRRTLEANVMNAKQARTKQ